MGRSGILSWLPETIILAQSRSYGEVYLVPCPSFNSELISLTSDSKCLRLLGGGGLVSTDDLCF